MKKLKLKTEHPKILVFRNGSIGNTLMDSPFFRIIKEIFPECTLYCVFDNIGKELMKTNPYIDKIF